MILAVAVAFGLLARFGRPWMVAAGLLTYPLYLLHDEVSNVVFTQWRALNRWVLLALVLAVVVAASWAVHAVVEAPMAPRLRGALERGWIRLRLAPPILVPAGSPAGARASGGNGGAPLPATGLQVPMTAPPPPG